ncbi:MAG: M20 family metallopeptidase, partial [Candidatus Latescibacterota bacterium]
AILAADGFEVERPVADWPQAPAVAVRYRGGEGGRVLQFNGHLDTVHLPFDPPRVVDDHLCGSGASDMKGGLAAAVEALRALRDSGALASGGILLTAHDHHEGPWGDRRQLLALIRDGYVGDGVLLPEYLAHLLPLGGRGQAIFSVDIERDGEPVHEVLRQPELPDVLGTGAEFVMEIRALNKRVSTICAERVGCESAFVGRIESGEIFNQSPTACRVEGTRRWVRPGAVDAVRAEFDALLSDLEERSGTRIGLADWEVTGDAFQIDEADPLVTALQKAHSSVVGKPLPLGVKPFVDDGNQFIARAGITALTHGPAALGAHTTQERVPVDELLRVARVYALTALGFCPG